MMKRGVIRRCLAWMLTVCLGLGGLMNGVVVRAADEEGGSTTGFEIHTEFLLDEDDLVYAVDPEEELQDTFTMDLYGIDLAVTVNDELVDSDRLSLLDANGDIVDTNDYSIEIMEALSESLTSEECKAYISLRMKKLGTYRLALKDDLSIYKELTVTMPAIGFYSDKSGSADSFIVDIEYTTDTEVYCIAEATAEEPFMDSDPAVSFDIMPVGLKFTVEEEQESTEYRKVYKISLPDSLQEDVTLYADVRLSFGETLENYKSIDVYLDMTYERTGLAVVRQEHSDDGATDKEHWLRYADGVIQDEEFMFVDLTKDPAECIESPDALSVYYYDETAKQYTLYENGLEITSEEYNEEVGAVVLMRFTVDRAGIYKVVPAGQPASAEGVVFNLRYPDIAFYRTDGLSDMISGDAFEYTDTDRTIYINAANDCTIIDPQLDIPDVSGAKAEDYVTWTVSEDHKSVKLAVRNDTSGSFPLRIRCTCQGTDGSYEFEREIWMSNERSESDELSDGINASAFSGFIISEKGYQAGSEWHAAPKQTYTAHGNTLQAVLDKLAQVTECPNTGYYYLEMSYFNGDSDNEKFAQQAQQLKFPDGVKGVLLQSGLQQECAWKSETPDFDQDDNYPVYYDNKNNRLIADIQETEGEPSLWYTVEWKNDIYVIEEEITDTVDEDRLSNMLSMYEWPSVTLDMTKGTAGVKLAGKWMTAAAEVSVLYDPNTEFTLSICGRELTRKDAGDTIVVKDGDEEDDRRNDVSVSFTQSCQHVLTEIREEAAASCTKDGYTGDVWCKTCGEKISTGQVVKAAGHTWDAGVVTKEATATETGVMTYTCTVCHETMTRVLPATGEQPSQQPTTVQPTTTQPTTTQPTTQETVTQDATTEAASVKKGSKVSDQKSKAVYKVTNASKKKAAVEYSGTKSKKAKTVKVPDTVTVNGVKYQVTSISTKAFSANKNVETITIGKNIKSLGKNIFKQNKKLKKIRILTTQLTEKTVKKGAFNGVSDDVVIQVPKKMLKKYKKLFVKRGLSKKVKIEAIK